jgi:hypothetical protein
MVCSFVVATRRGNDRIRVGSVAAVLGALFIMLVAEHRTQAQTRVGWMLPALPR